MTTTKRLPSRTASQFAHLLTMPVTDAFALACTTLDRLQIVPDGCHVVGPVSERLLAAAHAAGIADVDSLLVHQGRVLCDLTGLAGLDGEHEPDLAAELHLLRNVFAALVAAAGLGCGATVAQVLARVPALTCNRSWQSRRPKTADETLLLRLVAEGRAGTDLGLRGTCTYVLAEAGAGVGELTAVFAVDIAGDSTSRFVASPGTRRKATEAIKLDAWGSRHISTLVALRLREDAKGGPCRPLTYLGKHTPGSEQAQQSAQPILDKMRTLAGLNTADTTALSITLFRAGQTLAAGGSAREVIALTRTLTSWPDGSIKQDGGFEQTCRELRISPDELASVRPVVTQLPRRARRPQAIAA